MNNLDNPVALVLLGIVVVMFAILVREFARLVRAKADAVRAETRISLYDNGLGDDWLPRS